jgi:hypothetical protein
MAQPSAKTDLKTPQTVHDFFTLNLDSNQPRMLGNILSNDVGEGPGREPQLHG